LPGEKMCRPLLLARQFKMRLLCEIAEATAVAFHVQESGRWATAKKMELRASPKRASGSALLDDGFMKKRGGLPANSVRQVP